MGIIRKRSLYPMLLNLEASTLEGTNFRNANLSQANLIKASKNNDIQCRNSTNICETVLPNGTISTRCNQ